MTRRLVDFDPVRGLRIDYEDMKDGTFALHYSQDVEPILDHNKAETAAVQGRRCGDMVKVATVPVTVQYEWIRRYGVDPLKPEHNDLLERLLNSNEYRYLRTKELVL